MSVRPSIRTVSHHVVDMECSQRGRQFHDVGAVPALRLLRKYTAKDGPFRDGMAEMQRRALLLLVDEIEDDVRSDGASEAHDKRAHKVCDAYLDLWARERKR